jgi:hypothetical protein
MLTGLGWPKVGSIFVMNVLQVSDRKLFPIEQLKVLSSMTLFTKDVSFKLQEIFVLLNTICLFYAAILSILSTSVLLTASPYLRIKGVEAP